MEEPSKTQIPVLGGWRLDTRRLREPTIGQHVEGDVTSFGEGRDGRCLIRVATPEYGVGDRVRFTLDFDVTLTPIAGKIVNDVVQRALDAFASGQVDLRGDELVLFSQP